MERNSQQGNRRLGRRHKAEKNELIDELYRQVGQLKMELDWLNWELQVKDKRMLIDRTNEFISIARQAALLGLSRSAIYYEPVVDTYDIELLRLIDEQDPPFRVQEEWL